MNLEPKIILTISNIEGVLSQVTKDVQLHVVEEKLIKVENPEGKKPLYQKLIKRYDTTISQRMPTSVVKKTTITMEAYKAMTSKDVPEWYRARRNNGKSWDSLSVDEKLKLHFERMAYPHSFTFTYIDK